MQKVIEIDEIKQIIPHRYPFLLVDRVVELEKGRYIRAYKNITISEEVFQGHFPGFPIYPGVLVIEGLAQAGAIMAFLSMEEYSIEKAKKSIVYFMGIDKAKFRSPVRPGDRLEYRVEAIKRRGDVWVVRGNALVDERVVAEAELKAMIADKKE